MEKKEHTKKLRKHFPIYTTLNIQANDEHRNSAIPKLRSLHVERQKSRKNSRENSIIKDSIDKFNQVNSIWQDFKKSSATRSFSSSPKISICSPFNLSTKFKNPTAQAVDSDTKTRFSSFLSCVIKKKNTDSKTSQYFETPRDSISRPIALSHFDSSTSHSKIKSSELLDVHNIISHKQPKQIATDSFKGKLKKLVKEKGIGDKEKESKLDSKKEITKFNCSYHKANQSCITQALHDLHKASIEKLEATRKYEKMKAEFLKKFANKAGKHK